MAVSDVFVKFDPEKILEVSQKLEQHHKKFTQSCTSIKKSSEGLMSEWESESSSEYIKKINELDERSANMAEQLMGFSRDLAAASGIYKTGEADAKQKAEALPASGVFLV